MFSIYFVMGRLALLDAYKQANPIQKSSRHKFRGFSRYLVIGRLLYFYVSIFLDLEPKKFLFFAFFTHALHH
ncbi:hypothetical protein GUT183_10960 [Streptococcus ruminantium]|nr:hypothetical protein GUT183_10960 [Streptococcus ruminantium]